MTDEKVASHFSGSCGRTESSLSLSYNFCALGLSAQSKRRSMSAVLQMVQCMPQCCKQSILPDAIRCKRYHIDIRPEMNRSSQRRAIALSDPSFAASFPRAGIARSSLPIPTYPMFLSEKVQLFERRRKWMLYRSLGARSCYVSVSGQLNVPS
jgi:hypothetical protein